MKIFDRNTTAEEVARSVDLRGKRTVLTGASSGIGIETARALTLAGANVVLGVRDIARGTAIARDLAPLAAGEIRASTLDLSAVSSVTSFAREIDGPVDLLIANAGVSLTPEAHLPNGLDVRFATNHLGHFLLALLLHAQLADRGARIVVVSSAGHKGVRVNLDDLQMHIREHHAGLAYAESKTANILFAQEVTRRWGAEGIYGNAVLPGTAMTGLQRYHSDELKRQIGFIQPDGTPSPGIKTAAQAAATTLWAATAPELAGLGGLVLEDCAQALAVGPDTHPWSGFDPSVTDSETAHRLWDQSIELLRELRALE